MSAAKKGIFIANNGLYEHIALCFPLNPSPLKNKQWKRHQSVVAPQGAGVGYSLY